MNIFITGGAGYIGSKLTKILLDKNFKVTIYLCHSLNTNIRSESNIYIYLNDNFVDLFKIFSLLLT